MYGDVSSFLRLPKASVSRDGLSACVYTPGCTLHVCTWAGPLQHHETCSSCTYPFGSAVFDLRTAVRLRRRRQLHGTCGLLRRRCRTDCTYRWRGDAGESA